MITIFVIATIPACLYFVSACDYTGTMWGGAVTGEVATSSYQHLTDPSNFIFVAHDDGRYKMASVPVSDLIAPSSAPATIATAYVTLASVTLTHSLVTQLWDGTFRSYTTVHQATPSSYLVKNVAPVSCSGELPCGNRHFGVLDRMILHVSAQMTIYLEHLHEHVRARGAHTQHRTLHHARPQTTRVRTCLQPLHARAPTARRR
jgi:hypothetical protein